jgi:phosphatidylglycerol:prolipoprotein diacylglycerol transferase
VIAAVLGIWGFTKYKKHKMTAYLDLTSLGLLIGQLVGRWGNFVNREAFGDYTDNLFAMRLSRQDIGSIDANALAVMTQKAQEGGYSGFVQVHPTFLYESVWNLVGFVLIHFLSKRRKYDGQVFLMYLCWYGLGRVWIEALRTDSLMWGGIRVSQLLAGVCVLVAGGVLLWQQFRPHDPKEMFVNRTAEAKNPENSAE